ncbi:hypothetical protein SAY86_009689 [Trapa natans]|uniref:Uncharacterized protein n=1 Tax=Trapa natans TaxID=22666 RepID=A0AAN7QPY0_TRANT|nr:hypothetical protein SAY86_009689 [Trapa natans]
MLITEHALKSSRASEKVTIQNKPFLLLKRKILLLDTNQRKSEFHLRRQDKNPRINIDQETSSKTLKFSCQLIPKPQPFELPNQKTSSTARALTKQNITPLI